jgi:hypothetical protein
VSSVFDPRQVRWARVEVPTCTDWPPVVVRSTAPATLLDTAPETLLEEVTAGLAGRFSDVLAIDVVVDPPDVRRGSVRLVHAAVDPDGEGVAIETLLRRDGQVTCWVAPTTRYAAELATARRAMGGRPPLPAKPNTDVDEPPPAGVPVAEMRLVMARRDDSEPACWTLARRGPLAHAQPSDATPPRPLPDSAPPDPVRPTSAPPTSALPMSALPGPVLPASPLPASALPASALPVWLSAVTGAGPRPAPSGYRMVITSRAALERLLDLTDPDEAEVRAALAAPDLAASDVTALAGLAAGTTTRWSLEWTAGFDDAQEPTDEDWSTARVTRSGRTEVLDAGSAGLWRVLTDLPEILTEDAGQDMVALTQTTAADVWHELTLPLAD